MRALFQFGKLDRLRFISHLDLQRFMQMALRRTDLPIAYSQGFNPHPILSFASALAMGWTSEAEILDVRLFEEITLDHAIKSMTHALPPGLPLKSARLVDDRCPAMMARLTWADYRITLNPEPSIDLPAAIGSFLDKTSVIALRKTKSGEKPTDIRPMCEYIAIKETDAGCVMETRLQLTERATLKPDLLMSVLFGGDMERLEKAAPRIHRTALLAMDDGGQPIPLMSVGA